jgi:hypothetical protein
LADTKLEQSVAWATSERRSATRSAIAETGAMLLNGQERGSVNTRP